jgi:hypothetical protein
VAVEVAVKDGFDTLAKGYHTSYDRRKFICALPTLRWDALVGVPDSGQLQLLTSTINKSASVLRTTYRASSPSRGEALTKSI